MEIKKRNRTELKSFFVKNAIPTEGEFADLIDGMLSQKEDGIAKLPGSPLSIEASGDDVSQKKAINFYKNFADPNPSWVLSLNPRSDPANPATAKPGFSISDAAGNSRFFIDESTGNVGIGMVEPKASLDVNGGAFLGYETSVSDFGGMLKSGFYQNHAGDKAKTVPDKANPWSHLITARHSNTGNNYQLQIGASYAENDKLYFRKIARGGVAANPPWHEVATRGANTFTVGQNILSASNHLLLDRSASETTGGRQMFLELRQMDSPPAKVPVVYPFIRFHHAHRFWHRIEGRPEGFRFMTGNPASDAPANIYTGSVYAENSDIYFTNVSHNHTGIGNTTGYAAIENAKNYDALMILGRSGTAKRRAVKLWDYLQVNGVLDVNGNLFEKLEVIRCRNRGDWTVPNHPIMQYFKGKLTGKPVGTMIRAIQDHPSWRGHYWQAWVDVNRRIRVIHNYHNTPHFVR